jgi:hypothetical protein
MLALGLLSRSDNPQPYLHNESTSTWVVVGPEGTDIYEQSHLHSEPNWLHPPSRGVRVDSGATAPNAKTGTLGLLAMLGKDVNLATNYDVGSELL